MQVYLHILFHCWRSLIATLMMSLLLMYSYSPNCGSLWICQVEKLFCGFIHVQLATASLCTTQAWGNTPTAVSIYSVILMNNVLETVQVIIASNIIYIIIYFMYIHLYTLNINNDCFPSEQ